MFVQKVMDYLDKIVKVKMCRCDLHRILHVESKSEVVPSF